MEATITTNEWLEVATNRVPIGREVFIRTVHGDKYAALWNGYYWVDANVGRRFSFDGGEVQWFYVFERHPYDMGNTM